MISNQFPYVVYHGGKMFPQWTCGIIMCCSWYCDIGTYKVPLCSILSAPRWMHLIMDTHK